MGVTATTPQESIRVNRTLFQGVFSRTAAVTATAPQSDPGLTAEREPMASAVDGDGQPLRQEQEQEQEQQQQQEEEQQPQQQQEHGQQRQTQQNQQQQQRVGGSNGSSGTGDGNSISGSNGVGNSSSGDPGCTNTSNPEPVPAGHGMTDAAAIARAETAEAGAEAGIGAVDAVAPPAAPAGVVIRVLISGPHASFLHMRVFPSTTAGQVRACVCFFSFFVFCFLFFVFCFSFSVLFFFVHFFSLFLASFRLFIYFLLLRLVLVLRFCFPFSGCFVVAIEKP